MAKLKTVLHAKKNSNGEKLYRLALRVTVNRKKSYYHIGYNINPKDFDEKAEKVKTSHPRHSSINRIVRKKYDLLDDVIYESKSLNLKLTAKQIVDSIRTFKQNDQSFFTLAKEHIEDLKKLENYNRAISDKSKINSIKDFRGGEHLNFQEIDETMLKKLAIYLKVKCEVSERSIMNVFVLIRLLFNRAIRRGIVEKKFYPFGTGKVKIRYPESEKIGLNKVEILAIETLELKEDTPIWHTKNLFLFSFYLAGIRISDALQMKWGDIIDNRLYYKMGKNNKIDSLRLPDKAINILSFYRKHDKVMKGFIFPFLEGVDQKNSKAMYNKIKTSTKKINNYLGQIGEMLEISKKITSHIARHSFGQIAGDKVSPQKLQKLYRHSSLNTTIGYQSNFDHTETDKALNNVLDF
ncbi:site-specific integrase [Aquimarina sp. ERC-38]|uniref:site-specific integrase n=1 Tax=Aquimarina sp. ERC-38 TaxID=2949996 RepID=UPI002245C505|nr:site-specific integrase [Aquimarina sp. ERC-38]UZO81394.1 site-specific integrase [Aquimarina sp. ERC-38]